jgi:hypothetical protein
MHAALRSLESPDLAPDSLDSYNPPLPDDFGILLLALVGPADGDGEEAFYVTVCSPTWLSRATLTENAKGYEFVRHRLVVARWDPDLFRRAVGDLCSHTVGADWSEVANKLSRFFAWEFEDYMPQ